MSEPEGRGPPPSGRGGGRQIPNLICVICNKPIERNDKVRRWKVSPDDDYGNIVHAECCKPQPTRPPHQEHPADHGRRTTQEYISFNGLSGGRR